jgi:hypothetical protein
MAGRRLSRVEQLPLHPQQLEAAVEHGPHLAAEAGHGPDIAGEVDDRGE